MATLLTPGWATSFALLLWQTAGGFEQERRLAAAWLLGERVATTPRSAVPAGITGHDPSLAGWPWVEGTHAWVEPTAVAVLALAREGFIGHPRVLDGVRLLRDRQLATGGWNYGNTTVFGQALRPHPVPTGLSVLALCGERRSARRGRDVSGLLAGVRAGRPRGDLAGVGCPRASRVGLLSGRGGGMALGIGLGGTRTRGRCAAARPAVARLGTVWRRSSCRKVHGVSRMDSNRRPWDSRRRFLTGLGAATAAALGGRLWLRQNEGGHRADVVIAKADGYDDRLADVIERGLAELGLGRGMGPGQVGPAQAEPGRAEPRRAARQHAPGRRPARRPRCSAGGGRAR